MLTFRWKCKKLKRIEGSWNAWAIFHRARSQAFECTKMASTPKKPTQTLLSTFLSKGQHELKTLSEFFLESAFEDLSFHSSKSQ